MNSATMNSATTSARSTFRQSRFFSYLLPCVVLAIAGAVSWGVWDRERQDIENDLQAEFDTRVRETVSIFRERMLAYEQALHATHGLFATASAVQRGDFQGFVARLRIDSHPGLQGLGYSVHVPPAERARHVQAVRAQGFPSYAIRSAGERDDVTSAIYFEPSGSSLLSTLGSDYFAELSRRHNDSNVLVIPARFVSDVEAYEIVDKWINTKFEGGRHARRVNKIDDDNAESVGQGDGNAS